MRIALFCALVVACGGSPKPAPPEPAPVAAPPQVKRGGCGGPDLVATTTEQSRAVIETVGGAHKTVVKPLADYEAEPPNATFESGVELEDELAIIERTPDRIAAFVDKDERYTFVEVNLRDDNGPADIDKWAHELLLKREPYASAEDGLEIYELIFVYLATFTEANGRQNIEYAIVMKGCERLERYVRIVRENGKRLEIEVAFNDDTKPEIAARHLAAFFDRPLASRPPPERTFAYGHSTNL